MRRRDLRELEQALKALANVSRLELLELLKRPKGYSEIQLTPSRSDDPDGRPISREAVRRHVQKLVDIGVVVEQSNDQQKKQFVLDHSRLFSLFEQMRRLVTVRPTEPVRGDTVDLDQQASPGKTNGPHLVLARGVAEGRTFDLPAPSASTTLTLGRDPETDVVLDYDAFVSSRHAEIRARAGDYFLVDLPENKNGTFLNWQRLEPATPAPLEPGDILGVGRSRLVFRS